MTVPKLRFKEFDEDWNLSSLANISSIITGNTPSTSNREYYDGEFLFVSPADIQENRYIEKTKTTLTANGFSKCRHIPENSVLFVCIGSTIGKVAQNKVICATNQQINAVIPKKGYSSDFLYLQLERLAPKIKLNAGVQAVPLINKTEFGKTLLNTPIYIEQTKIAAFLSTVDEKISQLSQKHELLSQYKQGMMQKLFNQKIRFKADDGSEFEKWEETTLGKVTKYFKGYAFKSESYKENGIRIIRVSDLGKDSIKYDNDAIYLEESESPNYENWVIKKGDIVITTVGSKPHLIDSAVGRPIYIKNDNEGLLNQNLLVLRPIDQSVAAYFIFSQLLGKKYLTHIETIQRGNANQSNITVKDLQEFKVFNTLKEEQTKIANFLSAIDQKIEVVAQQIEQAKQWKKGLLQQMFV
ncbi:restriction endonuclease subunit S [Acinetobacter sp.]|uniref:restriction endonuclease subunit S n=1 Tax=Acinetobacter sp. TaxID=472 RepID=UPI003C76B24E